MTEDLEEAMSMFHTSLGFMSYHVMQEEDPVVRISCLTELLSSHLAMYAAEHVAEGPAMRNLAMELFPGIREAINKTVLKQCQKIEKRIAV